MVVCIYREQSSQHNFLVPPSGTVSSFRNTDFGLSPDKVNQLHGQMLTSGAWEDAPRT